MTPTELGDIIADGWAALTEEQKIKWNFWTLEHPITSSRGDKIGLYGWQGYYQVNAVIATVDPTAILSDPPTTTTPPATTALTPQVWTKRARLASGATLRGALAWIELADEVPTGTSLVIKQAYDIRSNKSRRLPRTRHVTVALETEAGPLNLQVPRGYYAETAGANKFASIKGATAARRRDLPLAQALWVNMTNGTVTKESVKNPTT
jgi:hypothetical protein